MEGGQLSPNTKLLNNPYGYNGEYHDLESGFQYLRARYYNPETARFIARDSYLGKINEPLTLNRYAYTANNPVKYKDPSGNDFEDGATGTRARSVNISTKSASSTPLLEWGSRGDAVVKIQKILDEQGYYLGPSGVDGVYGKHTYNAVKAYQTKNGLQVDGKVGSETWGSFNGYVNKKAAESRDRSKNNKDCGGIDAISSAAMGMGNIVVNDNVNMYTKDEASKYINGGVFGVYNTILNKDAILNLPKIVSYKDNGYSYDYVLSQHTETWFGGQITIPGEYSYELVYTDKPQVNLGIILGPVKIEQGGKATKSISRPSWKKVEIDMEEVISGHTPSGYRAKQSGIKDLFPDSMSEKVIEKEIRTAFKNSKQVGGPQFDGTNTRIRLQGQGDKSVIEMWYNIDTKTIETAYPVDGKKVKIK